VAASSCGAGWVTDAIAKFGLKLLVNVVNVITIVRIWLTSATDSIMAASSRGAGWVTEAIVMFGLKLLVVSVITIVRIDLPAQPTL
jgi:hypothetical protein